MYLCIFVTNGCRPLMLNTQRLSSLAFNLRDGRVKDASRLTAQMKQLAVRYQYCLIIYCTTVSVRSLQLFESSDFLFNDDVLVFIADLQSTVLAFC